jgi:hypothetical protein
MAVCRPVVVPFRECSRERFRAFRARIRVQAVNVVVLGDTGTAEGEGLKLSWAYDEPAQILTLTCTERPWYKSGALVQSRMQGMMEAL